MAKRRLGRWALAGYVIALGVSNAGRSINPATPAPDPDESVVTLGPVRVAFRDVKPEAAGAALPVILIHGSPGDNGEVQGLGAVLGRHRRAVSPDLPGFGGSTWKVPDYSITAHARYVLSLMDALGIEQAHVVGFSMGGGVVLHLADLAPNRIASLTLLSAIGAQEYELLGDYYLNHAIHGLQLGGLWLIENGIPHFGRLDGGFLTVEYARNFSDTDQRPLRRILATYQGPALVVQGDKDPLVDPAVAMEAHRLLPQSELAMFGDDNANHFMAFARADTIAAVMESFFERTEAGRTVVRAGAAPDRIAAAGRPFDPRSIPPAVGVALGVLLLLIAGSTLVSEDLAGIATGLMVSRGTIGFLPGTIACLVGIVAGDLWLYGMGRWLGRPAIGKAPLRWFVSETAIDRSAAWFGRWGIWIVLVTRFLPGTRLPTYLAAGILRARFWLFVGAFILAAALWTPLLVGLSATFGNQVLTRFMAYQTFALPAVLGMALGVLLLFKLVVPLGSWRGRRLLVSRWRRLTRWEFWPRWAFYPPIAAYIGWLAFKHRSLTLFTAVNPAIPGGGFVGESKAQILAGLSHAPDRVARWRLLPSAPPMIRLAALEQFMAEAALTWPVVLKPDVGERGGGVAIIHSAADALRYLEGTAEPLVAQEFVPGVEFGVFYYRIPGQPQGRIFAITDKRFPEVLGDGRSTLEELILRDDRAVSMAKFFLAQHAARLDEVPARGVTVRLVELGTHSRGSAFFDGEWIRTPALEAAIDQLSQGYAGFWFGRYDIKAPTADALKQGRNFKVLELNGATAEATSIYDPKNRLSDAYRTLRQQWSILFEIAAKNVAAGAKPATVGQLVRLIDTHRRSLGAHVKV